MAPRVMLASSRWYHITKSPETSFMIGESIALEANDYAMYSSVTEKGHVQGIVSHKHSAIGS